MSSLFVGARQSRSFVTKVFFAEVKPLCASREALHGRLEFCETASDGVGRRCIGQPEMVDAAEGFAGDARDLGLG